MTAGAQPSGRPDARANRDLILSAAAEMFRERDLDTTFEDIARRAGVGRATVYRHFATREALLAALMTRVVDDVERHLAGFGDPPPSLRHAIDYAVDRRAELLPTIDVLRAGGIVPAATTAALRARLADLLAGPLDRARTDGVVDESVTMDDVFVLIAMLAGAVRPGVHPTDRARAARLADAALAPRRR